jgi:hypothetical protein
MNALANSRRTLAWPVVPGQLIGQVIDRPGYLVAEHGEEGVPVGDRRVLFRQPVCSAPLRHCAVPVMVTAPSGGGSRWNPGSSTGI